MKLHLGLDLLQNNLPEFIRQGEEYVRDASEGWSFVHCQRESSHIRQASSRKLAGLASDNVAIDVGGTHTKVALGRLSGRDVEPVEWYVLFDIENSALVSDSSRELPLHAFACSLSRKISERLQSLGVAAPGIRSVSLVWSNQLEAVPFEREGRRGVTGLIRGIAAGTYRKEEWFIEGLTDGFDLGSLFLSSLGEQELAPEVFLVGNDTVFTMTALPGAHSGVVASSGGNCTDVGLRDGEKGIIFNTELGSLYRMPPHFLSNADRALEHQTAVPVALEDLLSGKWLPLLLKEYVRSSATSLGANAQRAFAAIERAGISFSTKDMRNLLIGKPLGQPLDDLLSGSDRVRSYLEQVSAHIVHRGGIAAAGLCYFSVFNQVSSGERSIRVALDSAMARHLPGYFTALTETFAFLMKSTGVKGEVVLLEPITLKGGGEISVPLIGATFAGALWK